MPVQEIISLKESKKWKALVEKTVQRDIHFLPEYASVFGEHIDAEPLLFFFGSGENFVLCPFFKRRIIAPKETKAYWDITSAWYYGGCLSHGNVTKEFVREFFAAFSVYCRKENIVSEFCRLNPYLDQKAFKSEIRLEESGNVVGVELEGEIDNIFRQFSCSCKRDIRLSEKKGVEIIVDNSEESVKEFYKIYTESMERMNAKKFYFFSLDFLLRLKDAFGKDFLLITAKKDGKTLSSFVFLQKYGRMYYFLSGRDPEQEKLRPSQRIIFEAIKIGKQNNVELLDLGGESAKGTLLSFKAHFSKKTFPRFDYKKVHNIEAYEKLCNLNLGKGFRPKLEKADFFPEYRK